MKGLLDAFNELEEDSGNVSSLCPSHGTPLETAVLSSERKHTSDLHTQGLPTLLLTRVLRGGEKRGGVGTQDVTMYDTYISFSLIQCIVNNRMQFLHQVTGRAKVRGQRSQSHTSKTRGLPKGIWMDHSQGCYGHFPNLPIHPDKGHHFVEEMTSIQLQLVPTTAFQYSTA